MISRTKLDTGNAKLSPDDINFTLNVFDRLHEVSVAYFYTLDMPNWVYLK